MGTYYGGGEGVCPDNAPQAMQEARGVGEEGGGGERLLSNR
jgi:hypothetical protein